MVKLLPCDLEVTDSNRGNSLLQSRVILHTINLFPEPYIGGSFVHWTAFGLRVFQKKRVLLLNYI